MNSLFVIQRRRTVRHKVISRCSAFGVYISKENSFKRIGIIFFVFQR